MAETMISSNVSQQYLMDNDANQTASTSSLEAQQSREKRASPAGRGSSIGSVMAREWVAVFVLCFVNLINYMDRFTIAGVLKLIQHDLSLNDGKAGLLQTAFIVSYMMFAPFFGYLGDRYNRKIIMCAGVFLWCLTTLIGSYAKTYGWFVFFRALVGIGEASYSTIAPTIISDLFINDVRSKMLALFYFAIPVGSGLGYITGSKTAELTGDWRKGLRITPALGVLAIILILLLVRDPIRGEREGGSHLSNTSWLDDVKALLKNPSFMLTSAGFTCVSFFTGALAFWGPTFIEKGFKLQPNGKDISEDEVSLTFGVIAMVAGIIGVPFGSLLAQKLRLRHNHADPLICAVGLIISAPLIFLGACFAASNSIACYVLIFLGQLTLNLNWSIVADMLLYVVIPTRRSTAEAFQILFAHAFGDASSPYLIGIISDALKNVILPNLTINWIVPRTEDVMTEDPVDPVVAFRSLQYALFLTIFVEILGSFFFFLTALYIEKDKALVDHTIAGCILETKKKEGESTRL
ncbi:protein spinster isoform X2 [Copidosoma floridanum]|uniref:protein spinster isoform X2 n=1 Tax=Copidosoma floridanum TaxID=29053 RepID=UPI0006C9E3A3|nr:protein spinster isoform X2 [Copidosoma floridanum]